MPANNALCCVYVKLPLNYGCPAIVLDSFTNFCRIGVLSFINGRLNDLFTILRILRFSSWSVWNVAALAKPRP